MVRQLLLLGVLIGGGMHGYRLNEYVAHAMSSYTNLKKPTAYYELEKLERDGYVKHEVQREGKRPERRVYEITEKGRNYFFDLLRQHLSGFARTYFVDDIGIAFMGQLHPKEAHKLLTEKREKVSAALEQFRELHEHGGNWRYVVSHNVAHLEADIAWLDGIIKDLNDTEA